MSLFLVHCGYYEAEICEGIYESHVNLLVVAKDFDEAREQARQDPRFAARRMHVDGLQRIEAVGGHRVRLEPDAALEGRSLLEGGKRSS